MLLLPRSGEGPRAVSSDGRGRTWRPARCFVHRLLALPPRADEGSLRVSTLVLLWFSPCPQMSRILPSAQGSAAGDPVRSFCAFLASASPWSPFSLGHWGVFPVDSKRVRTQQCPPFSLGTSKNEPFQYFSPLTPRNWNLFLPLKELTC